MSAFLDALRRDADWWDDILTDLDRDTETFSVTMNRSRARWFAAALRSAAKEIEDLRSHVSGGGEDRP